ncbi:23S rRNA m(5)U-1939 methyltransferase [Ferrimonas sediminum]|uniref:23S rRNA (uracil(1939)-C(5))-methyltransferase RlmD n=1 Tax=Ferrimonas sediminum TaxID=718193 RepID=A0A1G8PMV1_9GAMM|nr:23S rRNA (uracil(1939)-C(5))-methyltransferase RlmD [Ferrimonas sediminum]SDI93638.1 23S rRNA m(5)U-1939 methyltransferase [Ferrimonas sediminum]
MAQFFTPKSNKLKKLSKKIRLSADRLDHKGQGVAEYQGKVVFLPGLLPGEQAEVQLTEQKKRFAIGKVLNRLNDAPVRIEPTCPHFGACGGCQLQHLSSADQRSHKQQSLIELLSKLGDAHCEQVAEPIVGDDWHYRRRARLAVKMEQGALQLGFRQEGSRDIVAIERCPVLVAPFCDLIAPLKQLASGLRGRRQLGHIELTQTDDGNLACFRFTQKLAEADRQQLQQFAESHSLTVLIDGNDGIERLDGQPLAPFAIGNGEEGLPLAYLPGDFIQVNDAVNRQMVAQALAWLAPGKDDVVLDLFAGVGNFSLPLAQRARAVIAVEGVEQMVVRGNARAAELGLKNLSFHQADLNAEDLSAPWLQPVDLLLLDPARAGAVGALAHLGTWQPKRVLYVSCNPASLARDAKLLTGQNYRLTRVGLVDMFPHTQHLESMALFELQ